jgi:hypothetical protein
LLDALDYLTLLSAEAPERFEQAARRWFVRLVAESDRLSLDDAELAIVCLRNLPIGDVEQLQETLRALVKRRHESRGR